MNQPIFYTVPEVMDTLRIGRSLFYELAKRGDLKITKICGKTLVKREDLEAFVASLGDAA